MRALLKQQIMPEHFKRNQGLISLADQSKLLDMPIFIAGAGGLGGEIATHLAHMGAGNLYICDHDVFEESNTNRQRYCNSESIGQPKAIVTAAELLKKIPWGNFQPIVQKITSNHFPACFNNCAIVIDCLDSVSGKEMLENMAAQAGAAWLHGAVLQHEGFACINPRPANTLKSMYGSECQESGAGAVLSHVVAGTAGLMLALFNKWLVNPEYSSPLIHADFSIPEVEQFGLD